jgi:DNA-binding CsgD family transcriptional regulator
VQAARANAFARGHPLALELAAAALRADPGRDIDAGPPPAVMRQLLDAVLDGLPDRTIETLQAASTSRRVTEPILGALLARAGVRDAFDALRALPFVEETGEGLAIHDVVREALATDLRERDPERHARLRRRAWSYFETRAGTPSPERLRAVTADLISLIRNPVLRAACFPDGASGHAVERAEPRDGPAIRAIVEAREPPGAAAGLMRWWERQPGTFSVARGPGGEVAALLHLCEWEDVDDALLRDDAVARAWRFHMADHPPLPGTRVLTMRRWLGRDPGELLSPAVGACWLDVKRSHMELRPRLSRLYSAMARPDALAPIFEPLGFAPVGRPVDVGGAPQQPVWLDFGPGSVEGWLRRLVGAEVAGEEAAAAVDATAPAARLSRREAEVLGLIGEGYTNRAIAARLVISEKTAGRHVENIFCKLGVHNRAQAVRVGTQMGRSPDAARGAAPERRGHGRTPRPRTVEGGPHEPRRGRGRHPRDARAGPELHGGGAGHADRERVGELEGARARGDAHPQQVQGAHRTRRLGRHPLPVLRPLPRRGGQALRSHRGGDR